MINFDEVKREFLRTNLTLLQNYIDFLQRNEVLEFIQYIIEERKEVLRFLIAEENEVKELRKLQMEYKWYSGLVNRIQELAGDLLSDLEQIEEEDEDG